ncbi:hypothetical protein ANCCAN_04541 [Ancylostoma caninum]|uniref:Uncharacterized protein n=1 Tax=Ancylostoma caninum TaxID=29170 RepID=A0A368GY51_ANCCA|nr:hypothetical protein ANCCAN_04541 [Ancylostoma caninum]
MTPMPTRLAQYLHDLRSLNVNIVDDRLYVRPAYTLLLLNSTDEVVSMATLGFEMAREITRASYEAPMPTRRCFQQQLSKECSADLVIPFSELVRRLLLDFFFSPYQS